MSGRLARLLPRLVSLSRIVPENETLQDDDDGDSDDDDDYSSDDQEDEPGDDEQAKLLRLPSYVMSRARRAARASMSGSAPDQLSRGASPAFMWWLLHELQSRDPRAEAETLSSHDAVHGLGAKFSLKLHKETGFGYSEPKSAACIRAMTEAGGTSLFKFVNEHEAGQELRDKLAVEFGEGWRVKCFGRATHFVSHAWETSFCGLIAAIRTLPEHDAAGHRVYVWNDVIAINQHGVRRDARGEPDTTAEAERAADLASLADVIKHAGHVILYFEPLTKPRALSRMWVLFELMTCFDSEGELVLGFSQKGQDELREIAKLLGAAQSGHGALSGGATSKRERDNALQASRVISKAVGAINSQRAKASIPADEKWIKELIEKREGGHRAFDEKMRRQLLDVVDATRWAVQLRTVAHDGPQLRRSLEEALEALIERKNALVLLLRDDKVHKALHEKDNANLLREAMANFADEKEKELGSRDKRARRRSVTRISAISRRRLDVCRSEARNPADQPRSKRAAADACSRLMLEQVKPVSSALSQRGAGGHDSSQARWAQVSKLLATEEEAEVREAAMEALADNPDRVLDNLPALAATLYNEDAPSNGLDVISLFRRLERKNLKHVLPTVLDATLYQLGANDDPCAPHQTKPTPPEPLKSHSSSSGASVAEAKKLADEKLRAELALLDRARTKHLKPVAARLRRLAMVGDGDDVAAVAGLRLLGRLPLKHRQKVVGEAIDALARSLIAGGGDGGGAVASWAGCVTRVVSALAAQDEAVLAPHVKTLVGLLRPARRPGNNDTSADSGGAGGSGGGKGASSAAAREAAPAARIAASEAVAKAALAILPRAAADGEVFELLLDGLDGAAGRTGGPAAGATGGGKAADGGGGAAGGGAAEAAGDEGVAPVVWEREAAAAAMRTFSLLDPTVLGTHKRAERLFRAALLHPDKLVRMSFQVEFLSRDMREDGLRRTSMSIRGDGQGGGGPALHGPRLWGWSGALLAPFVPLLIESLRDDDDSVMRKGLVRVLCRVDADALSPEAEEALREVVEAEADHGVRIEMQKLPPMMQGRFAASWQPTPPESTRTPSQVVLGRGSSAAASDAAASQPLPSGVLEALPDGTLVMGDGTVRSAPAEQSVDGFEAAPTFKGARRGMCFKRGPARAGAAGGGGAEQLGSSLPLLAPPGATKKVVEGLGYYYDVPLHVRAGGE